MVAVVFVVGDAADGRVAGSGLATLTEMNVAGVAVDSGRSGDGRA